MRRYKLNVFELDISFMTEADPARVDQACAYAQEIYEGLKLRGNHLGRDRLLSILALGIVDDLLQLKQQEADKEKRLEHLLQCIEKKEEE